MELAQDAFEKDPHLDQIKVGCTVVKPHWMQITDAMDHNVPTPVIYEALCARFKSMQEDTFDRKVVAVTWNGFGGRCRQEVINI